MAHDPTPESINVTGTFFRYSSYDVPFWARPNTTDERWHFGGDGATQYLSATTDGAWAELIRNENLRSESDLLLVSMPLWHAKIEQTHIADYHDFETAETAGFDPEALVHDSQNTCQEEGRRLRRAGFSGVLYPSSALPGEENLVLFGPRISLPWGAPRRLVSGIPASQLSVGSPPADLLPRVRHVGARHAGYSEFQRLRRHRSDRKP
jgi:RES domain-containing protein